MPDTPNIYPFIRYNDAAGAIEWLQNAFGFEKVADYRNDDGTVAHAELRIGSGMLMLGTGRGDDPAAKPRDVSALSHGLFVSIPDPDAHYQRARAAGAEIVRELEDTDYGSREYAALDVEGNYWGFGTYRPE
jgi:uncharacterized glyoxalase superfamily protein PhnB